MCYLIHFFTVFSVLICLVSLSRIIRSDDFSSAASHGPSTHDNPTAPEVAVSRFPSVFSSSVCRSISLCGKTPAEFLALSPSSWTSPSLSMKRYPGRPAGRCGWQSEVAGCRILKSVPHYSLLHFLFSSVCVGIGEWPRGDANSSRCRRLCLTSTKR